jgi:hypothetical protein
MRRAALAATAIVLLTVVPIPAAHIYFENTSYSLPQNATDFSVNVMASGGETVRGLELFLGVQTNGPKIAAVDLTGAGLVFAGGDTPVIVRDNTYPDQLVYASTGSESDKTALGKLAVITLSTVGVSPGQYTFSLSALGNDSYFTLGAVQIPATLDGTVLNVVPEPAVWIQLLGLIGIAPAVLLCRRKCGK